MEPVMEPGSTWGQGGDVQDGLLKGFTLKL